MVRSRTVQLLNPSVQGKHLLYVRVSRGSGVTTGNPSAASEPDADDQATEPPRTRPQDLPTRATGNSLDDGPGGPACPGHRARARWPEDHLDPPIAATGAARGPGAGCSPPRSRGRALRWASPPATARPRDRGRPGRPRRRALGCRRTGSRWLRRPGRVCPSIVTPATRATRGARERLGIPAGRGSRSRRTAERRTPRDPAGSSLLRALPGRRAGRRGRRARTECSHVGASDARNPALLADRVARRLTGRQPRGPRARVESFDAGRGRARGGAAWMWTSLGRRSCPAERWPRGQRSHRPKEEDAATGERGDEYQA